ncbi:MAG: ABC transporter permease subunit [Devosia sp.]
MTETFEFWASYLTNGRHLNWYFSFQYTVFAALLGGVFALLFGIGGAALRNSHAAPARLVGSLYINSVRGIPDVLFFIFFPLAFEQLVELILARSVCPPGSSTGMWPPCPEANWYLGTGDYLLLASVSLGIVYGAFTANVIAGALNSVPKGQLEAARAFGMSRWQVMWRVHIRQMWIYALPGLSNCWLLLVKATSLLSLLQISDIVRGANLLGSPNFSRSAGVIHGDWRWGYYLALLLFYILVTWLSEKAFAAITRWASRGMPMAGRA